MTPITEYRNCKIYYAPPSGPNRDFDYEWLHNDFGGDGDARWGFGPSLEVCKEDIDDILDYKENEG